MVGLVDQAPGIQVVLRGEAGAGGVLAVHTAAYDPPPDSVAGSTGTSGSGAGGASAAAKHGAVAALVRAVGPTGLRTPHTGAMGYDSTVARIPAAAIRELAHRYARADRAILCWTLGITEHHNAVDNVLALINLALLTVEAVRRRDVPLLGLVFNRTADAAGTAAEVLSDNPRAVAEAAGAPVLGELPFLPDVGRGAEPFAPIGEAFLSRWRPA